MLKAGLDHAELMAYHRTLVSPGHKRRVHVQILNLDGDYISSLTPVILDGQVNVDVTTDAATPTRTLEMTFLDQFRTADIDADNCRSRIVRVTDSRLVEELEEWVDVEVFTGIGWSCDRDGDVVAVVGHGLERQSLGQRWKARHWPKKTKKTDVIKQALRDQGELAKSIPDLTATTPEKFTLAPMDQTWPPLVKLGQSMDRQLFYNGAGAAKLRRPPGKKVFTFDARHLLSEVSETRAPGGYNTFWVKGANPKGPKKRIEAKAHLRPTHPLAPGKLKRNDEPHYEVLEEQNEHFKTTKEAKARAKRLRDDATQVLVEYEFSSVPIPHLEENDLVMVITDSGTHTLRMRKWAFPLAWEGAPPMTVGSTRRLTAAKHHRGHGGRGR